MIQSDMSLSAETVRDSNHSNNMDLNNILDNSRFFVQYHGKATDELKQKLHRINGPMTYRYDGTGGNEELDIQSQARVCQMIFSNHSSSVIQCKQSLITK